jgi:hypothetical protein
MAIYFYHYTTLFILLGAFKNGVYFQPLPTTLPQIAGLLRSTASVIAPAMFIDVRTEL